MDALGAAMHFVRKLIKREDEGQFSPLWSGWDVEARAILAKHDAVPVPGVEFKGGQGDG